jgi:hypothetical protein
MGNSDEEKFLGAHLPKEASVSGRESILPELQFRLNHWQEDFLAGKGVAILEAIRLCILFELFRSLWLEQRDRAWSKWLSMFPLY